MNTTWILITCVLCPISGTQSSDSLNMLLMDCILRVWNCTGLVLCDPLGIWDSGGQILLLREVSELDKLCATNEGYGYLLLTEGFDHDQPAEITDTPAKNQNAGKADSLCLLEPTTITSHSLRAASCLLIVVSSNLILIGCNMSNDQQHFNVTGECRSACK